MQEITKESQYTLSLTYRDEHGQEKLGLMTNQAWYDDPKRLTFTLARYKFVAKMLTGCQNVLEVGCGDGFASRIVQQEVENLTLTDFDPIFIEDIRSRVVKGWEFKETFCHDLLQDGPIPGKYDGIYSLDVLEHIESKDEMTFLSNIIKALSPQGTLVIGMPSLESQPFASKLSKEGHVNCKTMPDLKKTMQHFFHNVFMFSMNDEVVHTGYHKMAHYLIALCCNLK